MGFEAAVVLLECGASLSVELFRFPAHQWYVKEFDLFFSGDEFALEVLSKRFPAFMVFERFGLNSGSAPFHEILQSVWF